MLGADTSARWFREQLAQLPARAGRRDGRVALFETPPLPSGSMPPLHAHSSDESYHVLSGTVVFYVGGERVHAGPGETVVAPAGTPRTFRVTSESASWLTLTSVRSLSRYEDFARAVARGWDIDGARAGLWPSEEEAAGVTALAAANGIEVLGPPGMLPCDLAQFVCV
jgi:mannose-6-phosphate isomerase-like protein (cupin superfamily)